MQFAIISDIHGNIGALEAVLADAASRGVDFIVNLGDILSGALFPRETADRLMALQLPTICGNHERQILTSERHEMGLSDGHAADSLRPDQVEWLSGLPTQMRLHRDILLVHGTPTSDLIYLLETVTDCGLREATQGEIRRRIGSTDARLILCGHSHIPRIVKLDGGPLIVNPGSVGLPAYSEEEPYPHLVETGSPNARYAIARNRDGMWSADLMAVEYDWEAAALVAERNGREDWARALRTGWA